MNIFVYFSRISTFIGIIGILAFATLLRATEHLERLPAKSNRYVQMSEIFPQFHIGYDIFNAQKQPDIYDFLNNEYQKPTYDDNPNLIHTHRFEELVPFAKRTFNYINQHNDDFIETMPHIKQIILTDLDAIIRQGHVSSNDIILCLLRFQAAISSTLCFPNQACLIPIVGEPLVRGLRSSWSSLAESNQHLLNFQDAIQYYLKEKLLGFGAIDPISEALFDRYNRKLPLKVYIPILGESYLGIRFLIDAILNDVGVISICSSKEFFDGDGRKDTPLEFTIHDCIHYRNAQLSRFPRLNYHELNHRELICDDSILSDKAIDIIAEKELSRFEWSNTCFKEFLNHVDTTFLSDLNSCDKSDQSELNNLKSTYTKVMICAFFLIHEFEFPLCYSEITKQSTPHIYLYLTKRFQEELSPKKYHDGNKPDIDFINDLPNGDQGSISARRIRGVVMLERDQKEVVHAYYLHEFLHQKAKNYEGLLKLIPNCQSPP